MLDRSQSLSIVISPLPQPVTVDSEIVLDIAHADRRPHASNSCEHRATATSADNLESSPIAHRHPW